MKIVVSIFFSIITFGSCTFAKSPSVEEVDLKKYITLPYGEPIKIGTKNNLNEILNTISDNDNYLFVDLYPNLNPPQDVQYDTAINTVIIAKELEKLGYERLLSEMIPFSENNNGSNDDGIVVQLLYGKDKRLYFIRKFYRKLNVKSDSIYNLLIYEQLTYYEKK